MTDPKTDDISDVDIDVEDISDPLEIPAKTSELNQPMSKIQPSFSGNLTEVSLPKLYFHFIAANSSGRLRLTNPPAIKDIFLINGKPVGSISNLPKERLGSCLVKNNKLTENQLQQALAKATQTGTLLGEYLVSQNLLSPYDLHLALLDQLRIRIFETFSWRTGQYAFYQGQNYPGSALHLERSAYELIGQGVRQGYALEELKTILTPVNDRVLLAVDNQKVRPDQLGLSPQELKFFRSIDNQSSLKQIIQKYGSQENILTFLACTYLGIELGFLQFGQVAKEAPIQKSAEEKELIKLIAELKEQDHFTRLGIDQDTPSSKVTSAFLKVAKKYHPDSVGQSDKEYIKKLSPQIFTLYNESHQILSNDASREDYIYELESGGNAAPIDVGNILESEKAFLLGEQLLNARKYKHALSQFEKAITFNPDEGEFLIYQGYCKFMLNPNPNQAFAHQCLDLIKEGLTMRKNTVANGYLFMARIYNAIKLEGEAKKMYEQALALEKNHIEATRELRLLNMRKSKKT
jgi:tetratricopeptide (TPR) repeat protein